MRNYDRPLVLSQTAAGLLRDKILRGELAPGTPLREVVWAETLNVSRNTLREALRDLVAEGLIEHRAHHGATVRALSAAEISEIYTIRLTLELRGVTCSAYASREAMSELVKRVEAVQRAAIARDWQQCGTASLEFHRQLVSFIGSPRLDALFASVAAQARLAFSLARDARRFQEPWVARDVEICSMLCDGDRAGAARALELYLQESERVLLEAARAHNLPRPSNTLMPDAD
ncbi:GntR family transcriptional regulator [Sinorhizobium numidicum]|uniref:GntR family transcriptional regulator n=1 Tax=Sinorhizobium numidicum TaxID=680248 RepID=A0ABY8CNW9_9HYPH|nr:GntR family transcriptional regulator [Sinorhizobium numidicum]WEX74372.1 GntR family transcriptional regulator [Sinorhizobium numidicum]WEX80359.1 GntR family transcriptional regulator [Sinorhizobium numidicum]